MVPLPYIAVNVLVCAIAVCVTVLISKRRVFATVWATSVVSVMVIGLAVERNPEWIASLIVWTAPGLVFVTNQSLAAAAVLATLMGASAAEPAARVRATVLGLALVCTALWSCSWLYGPIPAGLTGKADKTGYCGQTSEDSCSAAAAVMLLHHYGIETTERRMADLCLTRDRIGTSPLGLYRGLAVEAATRNLRLRMTAVHHLDQLKTPCIVEIGLKPGVPTTVAKRMESYGWAPGLRHTIVIERADPHGRWWDVADPDYGRERWPTDGIGYIWNGCELTLTPD
ncbi:MAG: cysteine peptidase family C39 domain-containing protein [Capsulimonadaceae bacterium]